MMEAFELNGVSVPLPLFVVLGASEDTPDGTRVITLFGDRAEAQSRGGLVTGGSKIAEINDHGQLVAVLESPGPSSVVIRLKGLTSPPLPRAQLASELRALGHN